MESCVSAEQGLAITARIDELTDQPALFLHAEPANTSPYDSKFGGVPYLPPGFNYPRHAKHGRPLSLLAQLNFAKLPKLPLFPDAGILQFYIENGASWGLNYRSPVEQKGFRVIYHETLCPDISQLQFPPQESQSSGKIAHILGAIKHFFSDRSLPFCGEFALTARRENMSMHGDDCNFDEILEQVLNEQFSGSGMSMKALRDGFDIYIENVLEEKDNPIDRQIERDHKHLVGGYPSFVQDDPRGIDDWPDHTILLFQMVSESHDYWKDGHKIMWGDLGIASFFITPEALHRRDFSNVLYDWSGG